MSVMLFKQIRPSVPRCPDGSGPLCANCPGLDKPCLQQPEPTEWFDNQPCETCGGLGFVRDDSGKPRMCIECGGVGCMQNVRPTRTDEMLLPPEEYERRCLLYEEQEHKHFEAVMDYVFPKSSRVRHSKCTDCGACYGGDMPCIWAN